MNKLHEISEHKFILGLCLMIAMTITMGIMIGIMIAQRDTDNQLLDTSYGVNTASNIDETNIETTDLTDILSIKQSVESRKYNKITTTFFEVYNISTGETCKLSDGELMVESVRDTLNTFLENSKYKVVAVGLIDNKIYIQQDTTQSIVGEMLANIVSFSDTFSLDDWLSTTESVYDKVNVMTDSVFSCKADIGAKHFIYIYTE